METTLPARKDIAKEHTWDIESVFASDADMEAALQSVVDQFPTLLAFKGRLAEGPDVLVDCLKLLEEVIVSARKIGTYTTLRFTVDTTDQTAAGLRGRAGTMFAQLGAATAFLEPELLSVGTDKLLRWANEDLRLAIYRHYFDTLAKQAPHVRSAEVEELLGLVQDPFQTASSIHGVISNADMTYRDSPSPRKL